MSARRSFPFACALAFLILVAGCQQMSTPAVATAPSAPEAPTAAPAAIALPTTQAFKNQADEIDAVMQADNAAADTKPLSYKKGNGLRILMTGHSWVAPGRITLPDIAKAAGYSDHVQRDHSSGGATGSPNSIWLNEHGHDRNNKPTRVILLPAIATGQWDVMTWGMYTGDTPEVYTQWMEICLKANPAMIFYIQDGWPTPRMGAKGSTPQEMLKSLQQMYRITMTGMFKGNYDALNQSYPNKVHIIPVGAAVVEMLEHYYAGELPGFDCMAETGGGKRGILSPDSFHLSRVSGIGWLVGYCYYGMLYQKSPELIPNFHPKGVDPTVDALMRTAAWHAITSSPFSGLTDANHDGIADQAAK